MISIPGVTIKSSEGKKGMGVKKIEAYEGNRTGKERGALLKKLSKVQVWQLSP